ncbi:SICA antigen [Plasmodium coatneyi]|uniref:SICA antigen n=1 Tax=Plasmodium coatneyi TaxID=208452 RepID=A0A1B1E784_9APIC|nr:SICA antigen [Plasmodium coatneyi]ANQ10619.1 SICA antigen [Plasmodium coatneyi]
MGPPKTSVFEQQPTKVDEEEEHVAGSGDPRAADDSANRGTNNEANKVRGRRKREVLWSLKPGVEDVIVTYIPKEGYDVTCKDSRLQNSLKTVIDNWNKDKGNPQKDWGQVWSEIENRVELLSNYISTNKATMEETHCKAPNGKDSSSNTTSWTEADTKACMLITAGLKHIYEIKEDSNDKQGGDLAKKNNRTFKQTAACLILNELIRKMKDKANSCTQRISIQAGINHAFSKSAEIRKETPCNGDSDCFECTQQDYSSCKMGNEQVSKKLKDKMDKDNKMKEALEDIYPPSNPSSSKTATLGEWFTRFSNNATEKDENNYEELKLLLILCDEMKSTLGDDMEKYKDFCNIMMKNIMLTTGIEKQYKNKEQNQGQGQMPCAKKVKDIPLCNLLKAWMWYMHWFCVPTKVIEYVLQGANDVRTYFMKQGGKYVDCIYDAAFKIPTDDKRYRVGEADELFGTSLLHTKIREATNEKKLCEDGKWQYRDRAPEGSIKPRAEEEEEEKIISDDYNSNKFKEIVEQLEEGIKQEEEEEKKKAKISESVEPTSPSTSPTVSDTTAEESVEVVEEDPPREEHLPEKEKEKEKEEDEEEEEEENDLNTKASEQQDIQDTQGEN